MVNHDMRFQTGPLNECLLTVLALVTGLFLVLVPDVSLHCTAVYDLAAVWTGIVSDGNIF